MSEISESARVSIILADFANVDGTGKLNAIGAGLSITGIDPKSGQSSPVTVVLICQVDPRFQGQEYAIELALYSSDDGLLVSPPGPAGGQPIRIAQPVRVDPPQVPPGVYLPPGSVWPGSQLIVNFQNGLPLAAGRSYEWRASIDLSVVCVSNLVVAGPPPLTLG